MKTHHHTCASCGKRYECDGTLKRNHDGIPEVICVRYHEHYRMECPECEAHAANPPQHP